MEGSVRSHAVRSLKAALMRARRWATAWGLGGSGVQAMLGWCMGVEAATAGVLWAGNGDGAGACGRRVAAWGEGPEAAPATQQYEQRSSVARSGVGATAHWQLRPGPRESVLDG